MEGRSAKSNSEFCTRKVVVEMADADKRAIVRLTSLAFCAG
jgi:hypothetical protein